MTISEARSFLHCPDAYGGIYGEKYGQAMAVAFKALKHTDALDKIRAEIIENSIKDYEYHGCGTDEQIIEINEVLRILDKYKAESEVKDADSD